MRPIEIADPTWSFVTPIAQDLGFAAAGVAPAGPVPVEYVRRYEAWLRRSFMGKMAYLEKWMEPRTNPSQPGIVQDARTVVSVALPYGEGIHQSGVWTSIASHARGRDYHLTMKDLLERLLDGIQERFPDARGRIFADGAPVMERTWAVLAGLGKIGKSGALMVPAVGPRVLLGELVLAHVPLAITPTPPDPFAMASECAECDACMRSCPTGAIREPGVVDSRRCLSYLTIENRDRHLPEDLADKTNSIFGCDICTAVCPANNNKHMKCGLEPVQTAPQFSVSLNEFARIPKPRLKEMLKDTTMARTGPTLLKRNAAALLKAKEDGRS